MQSFLLLLDVFALVLGLTVAGESIALLMGTTFSGFEGQEWQTPSNMFFMIIDIITGVAIIFLIFVKAELTNYPLVLSVFVVIVIMTHLFREMQYLLDIPNKYLKNRPLFIVNNLKLLLAAIIVISEFLLMQMVYA